MAQLRDAYFREILKWHPDRFYSDPTMQLTATKHAANINLAYEHLSEVIKKGPLPRSAPRPNSSHTSTSSTQHAYRSHYPHNEEPITPGFGDPDVFEVFVKSSFIISAGYNRAKRTLYLKLKRDRVYAYLDVPESVFYDFLAAESHGKFAHRYIFAEYRMAYVR
jgi:hypothetical protein